MKPLLLFFWGLLVVVGDLRIDGFDLTPDVVGWVMLAVALRRLGSRDGAFKIAAAAAVAGAFVSLVVLVPGFVPLDAAQLIEAVDAAVTLVLVFATCTGIMHVVAAEPVTARRVRNVRTAHVVLAAADVLMTLALAAGIVLPAALLVLGVATLVVLVWLLVVVWRIRDHPGLQREAVVPTV
ncbi:hypothetical protein GCM10009809_13580 [Isoptericola hypogeus]|uniref:Uncharacterized protein n=1 Tax=Isoptericola hypogeus TaxID=300179 RepID=A0ABN2J6I0_9MICO